MTTDAMNMDTSKQAVEPWYRQFWPWFIMSIPAATVVACMYTISLALGTTDSLVLQPVKGIDSLTEQHLTAEKRAVELGMNASVSLQRDTGVITVSINSLPEADRMNALELVFSHPTARARDHRVLLSPTPSTGDATTFVGQTDVSLLDRWYIVLEQGHEWRLTGTWTGSAEAGLAPRGAE